MRKDLNYIIDHVFLPLRLPQKDNSNVTKNASLAEVMLAALRLFQAYILTQKRLEWIHCINLIDSMLQIHILALHIRSQNAKFIVRRSSDQYSFESLEVSPTNNAIIETRKKLRRCFPGPAVIIDRNRITDDSFLKPLTELLVKLDAETPKKVLPIVTKAHSNVIETRNTVHPKFVTEMLIGILRAMGQPHDVHRIYKHTRDDVL
ncbi:MAG: hypothetical protein Q9195_008836 [Heterodermia aff. obscurata]